jgi:nucleoside-diphosphate-sugar epimerase
VLRRSVEASWLLHLQPSPPGWVDLGFTVPLMDSGKAREMLGWSPRHAAAEAFRELVAGFRDRAGKETPPFAPDAGGPLRSQVIATGVGESER